jgi:hypothetical protein
MFVKDANSRISLQEIMVHDWVTNNGITPFPKIIYPKLEVSSGDFLNAISKV